MKTIQEMNEELDRQLSEKNKDRTRIIQEDNLGHEHVIRLPRSPESTIIVSGQAPSGLEFVGMNENLVGKIAEVYQVDEEDINSFLLCEDVNRDPAVSYYRKLGRRGIPWNSNLLMNHLFRPDSDFLKEQKHCDSFMAHFMPSEETYKTCFNETSLFGNLIKDGPRKVFFPGPKRDFDLEPVATKIGMILNDQETKWNVTEHGRATYTSKRAERLDFENSRVLDNFTGLTTAYVDHWVLRDVVASAVTESIFNVLTDDEDELDRWSDRTRQTSLMTAYKADSVPRDLRDSMRMGPQKEGSRMLYENVIVQANCYGLTFLKANVCCAVDSLVSPLFVIHANVAASFTGIKSSTAHAIGLWTHTLAAPKIKEARHVPRIWSIHVKEALKEIRVAVPSASRVLAPILTQIPSALNSSELNNVTHTIRMKCEDSGFENDSKIVLAILRSYTKRTRNGLNAPKRRKHKKKSNDDEPDPSLERYWPWKIWKNSRAKTLYRFKPGDTLLFRALAVSEENGVVTYGPAEPWEWPINVKWHHERVSPLTYVEHPAPHRIDYTDYPCDAKSYGTVPIVDLLYTLHSRLQGLKKMGKDSPGLDLNGTSFDLRFTAHQVMHYKKSEHDHSGTMFESLRVTRQVVPTSNLMTTTEIRYDSRDRATPNEPVMDSAYTSEGKHAGKLYMLPGYASYSNVAPRATWKNKKTPTFVYRFKNSAPVPGSEHYLWSRVRGRFGVNGIEDLSIDGETSVYLHEGFTNSLVAQIIKASKARVPSGFHRVRVVKRVLDGRSFSVRVPAVSYGKGCACIDVATHMPPDEEIAITLSKSQVLHGAGLYVPNQEETEGHA